MGASSFLDQLLKTGLQALDQAGSAVQRQAGNDWQKYATGAAAGGALALLLGNRRARKFGGSALKLGGVAALGALAYKAWQDHQAQQGAAAAPVPAAPAALPAPQMEEQAQVLLMAMIAAARCDGHLDDREQGLLDGELQRLQADAATRAWVDAELRAPVDPARVAAACTRPELAHSAYLASVLVVDETSDAERSYLDRLARALQIEPGLQAQLEARAAAG